MKLHNLGEVNDFLHTVDRCRGEVWLADQQGSRINLKSRLSQYVAIAALLGEHGDDMELQCEIPEDEAKFFLLFSDHPSMGV
nr:MAG TPA: hypothetical protein [Caudoviricetes sp.]